MALPDGDALKGVRAVSSSAPRPNVKFSDKDDPAFVEDAHAAGVAGFCAGAPWGDIAERAEVGVTVATTGDVWRNGPGKALARA